MPNGKPGDHPLTDILVHHMDVFGSPCDDHIREIVRLGGQTELQARFDLYQLDPRFGGDLPDLADLGNGLRRLLDELQMRGSQKDASGGGLGLKDGQDGRAGS
jgi:hypothetical protein